MENQIDYKEKDLQEKGTRSFLLPHNIIYNRDLTMYQRYILVALIEREDNFKGQKGRAIKGKPFYVTQEWLAIQLAISDTTVKRSLKALEGKRYLKRTPHKGMATTYSLNWETIKQFNDNFGFGSVPDKEPSSVSCISSSSIKLENKTGESGAPQVEVPEHHTTLQEDFPNSIDDLSDEFLACVNDVLDSVNPQTSEEYLYFYGQLALASNKSIEYTKRAWQILSYTLK